MARGRPGTAIEHKPRVTPYVLPHLRLQDKPLKQELLPVNNNQLTLDQISDAIAIQDAMDTLKSLDLAELYAKRFTKEAVDVIVDMMRNDEIKAETRLRAAMAVLSRGWGNPAIAIRASSDAMDKDKRKNIEKEILDAQSAAAKLMEKVKMGFSIPIEGITQDGDGGEYLDAE